MSQRQCAEIHMHWILQIAQSSSNVHSMHSQHEFSLYTVIILYIHCTAGLVPFEINEGIFRSFGVRTHCVVTLIKANVGHILKHLDMV